MTVRTQAKRLVALTAIGIAYVFTGLPELAEDERRDLAADFVFSRVTLSQQAGTQTSRHVHPDLAHIAGWISTVGASVALNDFDGDGLANDVCTVDPRNDRVLVAPLPETGPRFEPFVLDPSSLPFDKDTMAPMGCLPGDLNEDGRLDVLVYYWGRTPIAFLRKSSSSQALSASSFEAHELVDSGERWYTNAATLADIDGDTHVDLVIGNYFPDGARVLDALGGGVEQMQDSMSRAFNGGRNRLFLWRDASRGDRPSVQFEEIEQAFGDKVAHGWTLAIGAADLDGDLLPELYFAHDFGPDRLLHNRSEPGSPRFVLLHGEKTLTTPNSKVLGRDSFKGMGVDFGDLNGDGRLDIFVSNIADEYALEESHFAWLSTGHVHSMHDGVAPYEDKGEPLGLSRSGWAWETRFGDFNNDGVLEALQATGFIAGDVDRWPELHELAMGNDTLLRFPSSWPAFSPEDDLSGHDHNPFYVRAADGRYFDLAADIGIDRPQVTRGIATADVDGDGDLDFAVANQWEASSLYRNESRDAGAFLTLRLVRPAGRAGRTESPRVSVSDGLLPGAGVAAIGCTAKVKLPDGRILVAEVDGGNGHSGVRSHDLHFGLGGLPVHKTVTVKLVWRHTSGLQTETLRLAAGHHTILLGQVVRLASADIAAKAP